MAAPSCKKIKVMEPEVLTKPRNSDAHGDFAEELTCSVCLELFEEPVLLPCGHCFCQTCIVGTTKHKLIGSCPICSTKFIQGTCPPSKTLTNLVARVKRDIVLPSINDHCKDHQEKLKLFCVDDGVLVCVICRDAPKHSSHRFLPVQDALSFYKDQLQATLKPLALTLKKSHDLEKEQEKTMRLHMRDSFDARSSITSVFEKLCQTLKVQKKETLVKMFTERIVAQKEMEERLAKLKEDWWMVHKTLDAAQSRLKEADPFEFLKGIKSCLDQCTEQHTRCIPVPGISENLYQQTSRGPIEYTIWREFRSAISPVFSRLTLDPETAHNNLVVSEDRTSVCYSSTPLSKPAHPKRFMKVLAVLGSEGFNSGRQYWVVDVQKSSAWIIGVAEETTGWNDHLPIIPENGLLALQLKGGDTYEALENPSRVLSVASKPHMIGVYLDSEQALLSFYNDDDMCLLHSFRFSTSAIRFPYFNPCAEGSPGSLTIRH
ncbi:zinc-binding protein A33-like [Ambystoma mexicanum]|uniref:zinc-binding protein A33-like n=1 Tax=Ambystoma mexicanum TaxID=8296 RepID=UPI0037E7ED5E